MRIVIAIIVLLVCGGTAFADSTSRLPTSVSPAQGSPWTTMHRDSFPKDPTAAATACRLAAAKRPDDTLTEEKCERFGDMLKRKECALVSVPNGIVFNFMLYQKHGQPPYVQEGVLKDLRDAYYHDASLCDLGDGVWGYHFAADGACNNPAFVLTPPQQGRWVCEEHVFGQDPTPPTVQYIPDHLQKTCCGFEYSPSIMLEQGGTTLRARGQSKKCYWIHGEE